MTTTGSHAHASGPLGGSPIQELRSAQATALVAGVFCLLVCVILLFQHFQIRTEDPLKSARLTALKESLQAAPTEEALKREIREFDLQVRQKYFRHLSRTQTGAWLLAAGLVAFLLAAKQVARYRRRLPMPELKPDAAAQAIRSARWARWSVGAVALLTAATFLGLGFGLRSPLPDRWQDLQALANPETADGGSRSQDWPSPEELQANWPRFRGPGGNAFCTQTNFPMTWDVQSGEGIAWKVPVPAPGFGSPVVWGNRVFLSGGTAEKREVFCFDTRDGRLEWQQTVQVPAATAPGETPEISDQTGYAAATVATDGRRVYAFFANGDLAAFTVDGQTAWAKNLGFPDNPYGHASSLLTWQDRLILQLDHGDPEKNQAKLYAFDGATGRVVWQRARPVPSSWATPIVISVAGEHQIITLADPWLIAYDARDGNEIWRAECLTGEVTPSPVFVNDRLLVVSPMDQLISVKPDGRGDVTKSHILWSAHDNIPDITSPVSDGELVFLLDTVGILTCFDAKTGEKLWEQDFETDCHASPTIVGDRLYLVTNKGTTIVVRAAREFAELARSDLGEAVSASPAFAHQCIFIRGQKHLYCVGTPAPSLARAGSPGGRLPQE